MENGSSSYAMSLRAALLVGPCIPARAILTTTVWAILIYLLVEKASPRQNGSDAGAFPLHDLPLAAHSTSQAPPFRVGHESIAETSLARESVSCVALGLAYHVYLLSLSARDCRGEIVPATEL